MREAPSPLVTGDILRREVNDFHEELRLEVREFRSDLHRALWILGAVIVAAGGAMAVAAVAIVATID